MKMYGVESSTWDHAYVAVTTPSGGWNTIYSNGAGQDDAAYYKVTNDISSSINGNSDFKVRFGINYTISHNNRILN